MSDFLRCRRLVLLALCYLRAIQSMSEGPSQMQEVAGLRKIDSTMHPQANLDPLAHMVLAPAPGDHVPVMVGNRDLGRVFTSPYVTSKETIRSPKTEASKIMDIEQAGKFKKRKREEMGIEMASINESIAEFAGEICTELSKNSHQYQTVKVEFRKFLNFYRYLLTDVKQHIKDMGGDESQMLIFEQDIAQMAHLNLQPPIWSSLRQLETKQISPEIKRKLGRILDRVEIDENGRSNKRTRLETPSEINSKKLLSKINQLDHLISPLVYEDDHRMGLSSDLKPSSFDLVEQLNGIMREMNSFKVEDIIFQTINFMKKFDYIPEEDFKDFYQTKNTLEIATVHIFFGDMLNKVKYMNHKDELVNYDMDYVNYPSKYLFSIIDQWNYIDVKNIFEVLQDQYKRSGTYQLLKIHSDFDHRFDVENRGDVTEGSIEHEFAVLMAPIFENTFIFNKLEEHLERGSGHEYLDPEVKQHILDVGKFFIKVGDLPNIEGKEFYLSFPFLFLDFVQHNYGIRLRDGDLVGHDFEAKFEAMATRSLIREELDKLAKDIRKIRVDHLTYRLNIPSELCDQITRRMTGILSLKDKLEESARIHEIHNYSMVDQVNKDIQSLSQGPHGLYKWFSDFYNSRKPPTQNLQA
ncbi:hypothetical protein PGT21_004761 [Puccinia graminis f. sp. tritici]|nr:hypothetical protein PGT21_004761 [Puccinia graminis f. sp. tritici]